MCSWWSVPVFPRACRGGVAVAGVLTVICWEYSLRVGFAAGGPGGCFFRVARFDLRPGADIGERLPAVFGPGGDEPMEDGFRLLGDLPAFEAVVLDEEPECLQLAVDVGGSLPGQVVDDRADRRGVLGELHGQGRELASAEELSELVDLDPVSF